MKQKEGQVISCYKTAGRPVRAAVFPQVPTLVPTSFHPDQALQHTSPPPQPASPTTSPPLSSTPTSHLPHTVSRVLMRRSSASETEQ